MSDRRNATFHQNMCGWLRGWDNELGGLDERGNLSKVADRLEELERERGSFQKAAAILFGCLNDAKELGLTVAVCGIEPDVMAALEASLGEKEQESGDEWSP